MLSLKNLQIKKPSKLFVSQLTALSLCLVFFIVSFSSVLYLLTFSNHNHNHLGENNTCTTCTSIKFTKNVLKELLFPAENGKSLASLQYIFALFLIIGSLPFYYSFYTLVKLKIRLNN